MNMMLQKDRVFMLPARPAFIAATFLVALIFNGLPWSGMWLALRPDMVALVLLYWCTHKPYRIGIGIAWSTLVAAELIAASVGLGWVVEQAANQLQTGIVIAGIIVIGILGYLMEVGIRLLERVVIPWRGHV